MNAFPEGPLLKSLRIAGFDDVLRCGIVAAASFRYSPLFRWERPYHTSFPEDTLLSYRTQVLDAIRSEDIIVIIAEDEFDPHEDRKTEAIIPKDNGWTPPNKGEKAIVGWAAIKLEPTSQRKGQYKNLTGSVPNLPPNEGRDLNRKHYDAWGSKVGQAKREYFEGCSLMNSLVVHPAYWKRGHGSTLVEWSIALSKMDNVDQGVSAAAMGARLYKGLGFSLIARLEEEGDKDDPEGVYTELLRFSPSAAELRLQGQAKATM